ncbi:MAG: hypothetical protein ACYTKD_12265 [Planctomycetota bacterium]|jgi:hypothetical protein
MKMSIAPKPVRDVDNVIGGLSGDVDGVWSVIMERIASQLSEEDLRFLGRYLQHLQGQPERDKIIYVSGAMVEGFMKGVSEEATSSIESAVAGSVRKYLKPETKRLQQAVARVESYEHTIATGTSHLTHQLLERMLADISKAEAERDYYRMQLADLRARRTRPSMPPWTRPSTDVEICATNDAQILGEDGDDFLVVFYEEDMTPVEARVAKLHFVNHPGRPREGSFFVIVVYRDKADQCVKASAWPIPSNWHSSLRKNATE